MSNLLEDVFIVERLQILNEDKDHGVMKVRGVFQRADEQNKNGRVYSGPLLMREMNKLQDSIDNRRLVGELDHPSHDAVKLSQVSHLITKLEMKGKEVIGEAEILDTPMGKVAQALIKGGVQVGISSRGMGTLSEGEDGRHYVNEDFRLITWDLVADPSTRGAYPGLSESSIALANEICESMIPKVTAEKVFTSLLEEAFNGRLDEKSLDPVGQEDDDVDNDGDSDSSDKYLKARRAAIGKAMGKKGKKTRKDEGYGKRGKKKGYGKMVEAYISSVKKSTGPQFLKKDAEAPGGQFDQEDAQRILRGKRKEAAKAGKPGMSNVAQSSAVEREKHRRGIQ